MYTSYFIIINNIFSSPDDVPDIEVISNASSDDYCVVPLPACFDPDIPLNADDFEQALSVEPSVSLAQEMDPLGSPVDQQDAATYEEQQSVSIRRRPLQYGVAW
jgi:ATP adenylyltransferase/5',5'''-P-1,P-4-tetraphosphate phosphorylase II